MVAQFDSSQRPFMVFGDVPKPVVGSPQLLVTKQALKYVVADLRQR